MGNYDAMFFESLKDDIFKNFFTEMDKFSGRIAIMMRDIGLEIIKQNACASGNLAGSVSYDVKKVAWEYVIKVFVNASYTNYIYEGTRPHYPPVKPLIQWVRRKGLTGSKIYSSGKRNYYRKSYNQSEEDKIIAAKIAYKISRKGTRGIKFFDIALKQALPKIEAELQKL
ncbi:MAG: hypothetical protein R6W90_07600 [Ignavibacteriaceae bacterium]